jgi:hypothetical protein
MNIKREKTEEPSIKSIRSHYRLIYDNGDYLEIPDEIVAESKVIQGCLDASDTFSIWGRNNDGVRYPLACINIPLQFDKESLIIISSVISEPIDLPDFDKALTAFCVAFELGLTKCSEKICDLIFEKYKFNEEQIAKLNKCNECLTSNFFRWRLCHYIIREYPIQQSYEYDPRLVSDMITYHRRYQKMYQNKMEEYKRNRPFNFRSQT